MINDNHQEPDDKWLVEFEKVMSEMPARKRARVLSTEQMQSEVPWFDAAEHGDNVTWRKPHVGSAEPTEPYFTAELHEAALRNYGDDWFFLSGCIHNDKLKRFRDGEYVTTTRIKVEMPNQQYYVTVSGNIYKVVSWQGKGEFAA